jgi:hypothetical protein
MARWNPRRRLPAATRTSGKGQLGTSMCWPRWGERVRPDCSHHDDYVGIYQVSVSRSVSVKRASRAADIQSMRYFGIMIALAMLAAEVVATPRPPLGDGKHSSGRMPSTSSDT